MKNTLIISDLHIPYHHQDAFEFLEALAYGYDCEVIKCTGDLVDNHAGSFHEIEYGVLSAKEEHTQAYDAVQELYRMFPKMDIVIGNHDAIPSRKAKAAGLPQDTIKSYNDLYDTKWNWSDKHVFKLDKDNECLLVHTMSTSTLNNAAKHSHCSIQGHHHSSFGIEYFTDTNMIRWSITAGCLIDLHHPAFNYASGATMKRPVIGCAGIIEGTPRLFPMTLTKKGRWNGIVP